MSNVNKFYSTSFALTKLKHAIITSKSGQKCLVIPLDDNYLLEKDGAVYMQTDVCVRTEVDANENWGFVKQKLTSDKYKELGAEKSKEIDLPFLANLKVFANKSSDVCEPVDLDLEEEHTDVPF